MARIMYHKVNCRLSKNFLRFTFSLQLSLYMILIWVFLLFPLFINIIKLVNDFFFRFILCQLWTVYLEQIIALQVITPSSGNRASDEQILLPGSILLDFWGKVTPGILQLVSHSKVLAEMVNLHFLGLLEALMECHSTILVKLLPLWTPVLFAFHAQLPDHVKVRLQAIQDYKPSDIAEPSKTKPSNNEFLLKWLQRMQFKMGQIEMQASNVTQFFTV